MELALQPLFEKIQDETDEVYFQDVNGRILKIILWAEAGQQAVDLEELHQNFENNNGSFQRDPSVEQQQYPVTHSPSPVDKPAEAVPEEALPVEPEEGKDQYEYYYEDETTEKNDYDFRDFLGDDKPLSGRQKRDLD